jgi:hypothetical protein
MREWQGNNAGPEKPAEADRGLTGGVSSENTLLFSH